MVNQLFILIKKNRNIIIGEKIKLFIFRNFLTKKINLGKFVEIHSFIDSIEVLINSKGKNQELIHSKIIIDSMKFIIDKLKDKTLLYLFLGLEESKIEMLDKIS